MSLDFSAALVTAFDHSTDVYVFVKDRDRRMVACTKPFARLLGYRDPELLLGLRDEELSPEYLADHYRQHDQHVLGTGEELIDLVELVRNIDGTYDWFLTSKSPVLDEHGAVQGIVGVTRSLHKRATADSLLSLTPAVELISRSFGRRIPVTEMAASVSMSASAFTRAFGAHFGSSPHQYLMRVRIMAACDLLSTTELSLREIATEVGFYDQSHFSRDFTRDRGMPPAEYRARFRGVASQRAARIALS